MPITMPLKRTPSNAQLLCNTLYQIGSILIQRISEKSRLCWGSIGVMYHFLWCSPRYIYHPVIKTGLKIFSLFVDVASAFPNPVSNSPSGREQIH